MRSARNAATGTSLPVSVRPRRRSLLVHGVEARWAVAMVLPAVLGFAFLTALPLAIAGVLSFTRYRPGGSPTFVGFQNYVELSRDPLVIKSLSVTFSFAVGAVILTMIVALALAILVSQPLPGTAVFRTIFYLPVLLPSVAAAILWLWVFEPDFGLLNGILKSFGIPRGPAWISDSRTVLPSLIVLNAWACGTMMIIFVAGLRQIPTDLYDAVAVDGGGSLTKFRHVTLPMLTPIIFFNLTIGLLGFFQAFSEAFIMTQGGPANASLMYVFFLFRTAFYQGQLGYASALMFPFLLLIVACVGFIFIAGRRFVYYEGLR